MIAALRQRREGLDMSMNKLAELSDVSLTMISFIERELRSPSFRILLRMANALEVDLWQVLKKATDDVRS